MTTCHSLTTTMATVLHSQSKWRMSLYLSVKDKLSLMTSSMKWAPGLFWFWLPWQWQPLHTPLSCRSQWAWSRLESSRTSPRCACTGTGIPASSSSWWLGGCCPPVSCTAGRSGWRYGRKTGGGKKMKILLWFCESEAKFSNFSRILEIFQMGSRLPHHIV